MGCRAGLLACGSKLNTDFTEALRLGTEVPRSFPQSLLACGSGGKR